MFSKLLGCALGVLCFSVCHLSRAADPEGARGLLADVDRLVAGEESEGWFGDDDAFRNIAPAMLESTCRATPDARAEALTTLQQKSAAAGDPRSLYAVAHELSDSVQLALGLERQRRALELALARVDTQCPFFVQPKPGFKGLQSDRQRFTLSLETAGRTCSCARPSSTGISAPVALGAFCRATG